MRAERALVEPPPQMLGFAAFGSGPQNIDPMERIDRLDIAFGYRGVDFCVEFREIERRSAYA
jgi:hypothetical protein